MKPLSQMTPEDVIAQLPVNARASYLQARGSAESKGDMMGMRAWLRMWRRYVPDPTMAMIDLDVAKLLQQNKGDNRNEAMAKANHRSNLSEAKMMTRGIRTRTRNPELLEMADKLDQEIDRELSQLK